ncbi:MAG: hypothetical protein JHC33_07710 [Ignisphaera sp.]|nr:hypothetical protein [Ignisphaera sp.]
MAKKETYTKETLKVQFGLACDEWGRLDNVKSGAKRQLWEDCAALTLPYIYPKAGATETTRMPTPYNSVGPAAVNTLASKLTLALLPPTGKFFRLMPYTEKVSHLTTEEYQALNKELSKVEQEINMLIAAQGLTVQIFEAVKLLIITGNTLLHKIKGSKFKVFNPKDYCVDRDYVGNVMTILIKEQIDTRLLPAEFIKNEKKEGEKEEAETETIYTSIYKVDATNWIAYQEVDDQILSTTIVKYTDKNLPYIPLRWTNVHNEDYGRGLVEQYKGDLENLEEVTRQIIEGTGIASKVVFGLKPGKTTKADDLTNALNGDIILGDLANDVTTLQTNKSVDFNISYKVMEGIEQRLGKAFLMFSAAVRDSERTTSAEIRATVNELDAAFGGTYTVLAQDLQIPLLRLLLSEASPQAHKLTEPSIISGASAISREKDLQDLDYLLQKFAVFGPEMLNKYLKVDGYISEVATALGIDPEKILKSPEEIKQEAQAIAQAQAASQPQLPPQQ